MVTTMATKAGSIRLVAVASMVGTTIEWYDFFLYGTAVALVFNRLYFPTFDPLAGTLAAFGTYTVGFVARPIGGIVIGHYGDRIGRKSMLVLTLIIMGVSTFGIGLLPTYSQIGPWAAVSLVILRLAQGFGVGGEWGGAVLMAVEHAPAGARGFYGSWPQIGVPAGLLLSTAVFAQFARLPEDQFLSWGWRVPFLVSILLVGVGLIIRLRILETPAFTRVKEARTEARRPIVEVLQTQWKEVLLAMGARLAENGAFYIYTVFVLVYGTRVTRNGRTVWSKPLQAPTSSCARPRE
jgi:MHS family shikimate/dehydroshikimate transporter-like MFS transporter